MGLELDRLTKNLKSAMEKDAFFGKVEAIVEQQRKHPRPPGGVELDDVGPRGESQGELQPSPTPNAKPSGRSRGRQ